MVLGLDLFSMLIEDLEEGINSTLIKFAHETKLGGVAHSEDREIMKKLSMWTGKTIIVNLEKCRLMHLGEESFETDNQ